MQALGLIETIGLVVAIESADAMLKAADVNIVEKTYVGGGLVMIAVEGDVAEVKAAVETGGAAVRRINNALLVSEHVIPHPHENLDNVIVSATPLKNEGMLIAQSAKTESKVEFEVEIIEEETKDVPDEVEIVAEAKIAAPLQMDLSQIPNKEDVDKMVLEYGLEESIVILSKFKVIELRNLARDYKNFGIAGRSVSKANKRLLLTQFKEYYGNN